MSSPESEYNSSSGYQDTGALRQSGYDPKHLNDDMTSEAALRKIKTAGALSISPELFEKIYLSPQNKVAGELRKTFGNPTPIAIVGYLIALTPLSCDLMGWRGAGGDGSAGVGSYYFFGGLMMFSGGLLEWIIGNTFPAVVMVLFGMLDLIDPVGIFFWTFISVTHRFSFGATLTPSFNAYGAYSSDPSKPTDGLKSASFDASFAFFQLFMGLLSLCFLICSLRTNAIFVAIFVSLVMTFVLLAGTYWNLAAGHAASAAKLEVAAGAFAFMGTMAGWWIFLAQMLASVDFPISLPVGDLSHMIPGYDSGFEISVTRRNTIIE
ncbi:hypothetical protein MMC09_000891 [Bachmanniomyces sp. S44760]|nr:hypothetical protein [Bachmanniomyces sp. S44760]